MNIGHRTGSRRPRRKQSARNAFQQGLAARCRKVEAKVPRNSAFNLRDGSLTSNSSRADSCFEGVDAKLGAIGKSAFGQNVDVQSLDGRYRDGCMREPDVTNSHADVEL
jgi:hypothetical protein